MHLGFVLSYPEFYGGKDRNKLKQIPFSSLPSVLDKLQMSTLDHGHKNLTLSIFYTGASIGARGPKVNILVGSQQLKACTFLTWVTWVFVMDEEISLTNRKICNQDDGQIKEICNLIWLNIHIIVSMILGRELRE